MNDVISHAKLQAGKEEALLQSEATELLEKLQNACQTHEHDPIKVLRGLNTLDENFKNIYNLNKDIRNKYIDIHDRYMKFKNQQELTIERLNKEKSKIQDPNQQQNLYKQNYFFETVVKHYNDFMKKKNEVDGSENIVDFILSKQDTLNKIVSNTINKSMINVSDFQERLYAWLLKEEVRYNKMGELSKNLQEYDVARINHDLELLHICMRPIKIQMNAEEEDELLAIRYTEIMLSLIFYTFLAIFIANNYFFYLSLGNSGTYDLKKFMHIAINFFIFAQIMKTNGQRKLIRLSRRYWSHLIFFLTVLCGGYFLFSDLLIVFS